MQRWLRVVWFNNLQFSFQGYAVHVEHWLEYHVQYLKHPASALEPVFNRKLSSFQGGFRQCNLT